MALDVGLKRDRTVVAVGHLHPGRGGRQVVIDRVLRWSGTRGNPVSLSDVEESIVSLSRSYGRAPLHFDPYQAAQLTERLKRASVTCKEFTFSTGSVNRLARSLYGALRDRAIVLPNDPELAAELAAVRLVEVGPGLVRLDHRSGEHDDQAVTVAMVAATLLDRPSGGARLHVPEGELPPVRLVRSREKHEPPPVVVKPGEERPTDRLVRFSEARKHAGYQPPGSRRPGSW
jgi:hypothetical protein